MVGVARHWNTWDAGDPLALVHLPTGLTLRFAAYSNKEATYRLLGVGSGVTLLEHLSDAGFVRARVAHAGSELELILRTHTPHAVSAQLRVLRCGEWGLRYWLALEVGFSDVCSGPAPWREDEPWITVDHVEPVPPEQHPRLLGRHRSTWVSVASAAPAVFAGSYRRIDTFRDDISARGYYVPPRAEGGSTWGVLRFNAQMHPDIVIAATLGTDRAMACRAADEFLRGAPENRGAPARGSPAREAVRDVVAWNTVWDRTHHRPTTVLTRNWLAGKFSGWGVWLDDMLYHALLAALVGDWEGARANLDAALEYLCPEGNLPCLRTATQEWVDRSQSPIGGYVLWRIFLLTGDRSLLVQHFPVLLRAHRWWLERRDGDGDGLIEYGSSRTGSGAFVHTKQAAMDESLMDNAPIFDEAAFDPAADTLTMAEPGLSSLVSLDAQFLARIADELGETAEAERLRATATRINARISEHLWDSSRGVFAARHWSGAFARSLSPTCFLPLLAGAASDAQAAEMVERHLLRPDGFWGERVLPSSTFDDPASADDVYWRGRIWPPHLFLVWEGLRRDGRYAVATDLSALAWKMFQSGWADSRQCRENYHRSDPAGDATPDSDGFYTWGALIPAMRVLDAADHSPWEGRVFAPTPDAPACLAEAGRRWCARREALSLRLSLDDAPVLDAVGAERLRLRRHDPAVTIVEVLPAPAATEVALVVRGVAADTLLGCEVDGASAAPETVEHGVRLALPPGRRSLVALWRRSSEPADGPG